MPIQGAESRMTYCKDLVGAALDGLATVWPLQGAVSTSSAIGAAAGGLGAALLTKRRVRSSRAAAGVLGAVLGCSAAMAWNSRSAIVSALRTAVKRVNAVRDGHWLSAHPIDYA